jgi:hypothetical protein
MNTHRKLVPLSAVREEPVRWLWPDRIPLGAVTLLDGDPGQSKSTLLYEIAARVTAGRTMPFCQGEAKAGGVVLLQAEDSLASTVRPALARAGTDYNRVRVYDRSHFLEQPLTLPDDLPLIEEAASEIEARLVVIDPFAAFLSGNPNSEQSVRRALGPLAAFAERAGLAVVIARHLAKRGSTSPLYRGVGSIGIIALARSALWVCNDPESDDPYQHILVQTKSNLSGATSLCYRTAKSGDVVVVEWLGESKYTARDTVSDAREDRSALEEAKDALRTILADGPLWVKEVIQAARQAGVSKRTLDRAKRALGVRTRKKGGGWLSRWTWELPGEDLPPQPDNDARKLDGVLASVRPADPGASVGTADSQER